MALIMTHIRFALDMAKQFNIACLEHYISGTVYPDSRWVSGIERELTHDIRFQSPDFPTDDFTRGWQVHCICDQVQTVCFENHFPELQALPREDRWIRMSAVKLLQDMYDLQAFDFNQQASALSHIRNPNGEEITLVKSFYNIILKTYRDGQVPAPEQYRQLWLDVGLAGSLADRIIQELDDLLLNPESCRLIESSFDEMIVAAESIPL